MSEKEAQTVAEAKAEEDAFNPEEEVTEGNWMRPQVEVKEVKAETGEENEDVFWKCRSKLYRWAADSEDGHGMWKERGLGEAKLLQHKETKKIRFLLRQEKTLKIVSNHYVVATDVLCQLMPNVSSEKIYVWTVMDYAEDDPACEQFALKFGQTERKIKDKALLFKEKFEEAAKINSKAFGTTEAGGIGEVKKEEDAGKEKKEAEDKKERDSDKK